MLSRDHYAILGVAPDASDEEIERAYRHLSRRYHPELNPGDPGAATAHERIEVAYKVLSDPERRARYDREGGLEPDATTAERPELTVEPGDDGGGSFRELFRALRGHSQRSSPSRGEDIQVTTSVPLRLAERGKRKSVDVRRLVRCADCDGRGDLPSGEPLPCPRCRGTGNEIFRKGALSVSVDCSDCGGDGLRSGADCGSCHGSGVVAEEETVVVKIPPGVTDGQMLRRPGLGHYGRHGGPPGDLVVTCRVEADRRFERQGPHLRCRVPISVTEAVLGARIDVPTLDGTASLRVPPGTQNGTRLRLREHGLEMSDGRRGDLFVEVELWLPEVVDEDLKELVRRFGEQTGTPPRDVDARATVQP